MNALKNCIICGEGVTVRDFTILRGKCKLCNGDSSDDETALEERVKKLEKTVFQLSNRLQVQEREMSDMKSMINSFMSSMGLGSANIVELDD